MDAPYLSPAVGIVVGMRGVDLGQQEAGLRAAVLRVHVAGHGEARLQDLLGVVQRRLQQLLEVLVLGHLLVAGLAPLGDGLRKEKEDVSDPLWFSCPDVQRGFAETVEGADDIDSLYSPNTFLRKRDRQIICMPSVQKCT